MTEGDGPCPTYLHRSNDSGKAVGFYTPALRFSRARLIEKDDVCTIILEFLTAGHADLVFKGGTCLAKIYADFYRMSEDLDFVIPMPIDAPRSARSARQREFTSILSLRFHRRFRSRTSSHR